MDKNVEKMLEWRKSPLLFIEDVWGLTPQPLKKGIADDLPAEEYKVEHFEPFIKGKHVTWQQWLIFRAVEKACRGEAPRQISVASGHGIGKTGTIAILKLWFLFCFTEPQVPCTANTSDQLSDILWKESKKWLNKMHKEMADQYEHQSQYIRMKYSPDTAFARARTAKKEAPEALAGVHADHVMMIIDEASGVVEEVFETASGALTNANVFVIMISNPTRLTGYFYDSHHKNKRSWQTLQFDSRDSPIVDNQFVKKIIDDYGEDSPQFCVRVKGMFPDAEEDQLIPRSLFDAAAERPLTPDLGECRCLSVDVARYGGDKTVLSERQGMIRVRKVRQDQDTVATANDVVHEIKQSEKDDNLYDYVMIDSIGIGSGVFDTLKERQRLQDIPESVHLIAVNVAESADNDKDYQNKRVEYAHRYKKFLATGAVDPLFREESCAVKFGKPDSKGRNTLEPKEKTKERIGHSPDYFDSAIISFAVQMRRDTRKRTTKKRKLKSIYSGMPR